MNDLLNVNQPDVIGSEPSEPVLPDPSDFLSRDEEPRVEIIATPEQASGGEAPVEDLQKENEQLRHDLEVAEKRRADTETWGNASNVERLIAERVNGAWEQRAALEKQAMDQAKQLEPPSLENPEELLDDPAKLMDYMNRRDQATTARILAMVKPQLDMATKSHQRIGAISEIEKKRAMKEAKRLAETQGYDDFDEFEEGIRKNIAELGEGGDLVAVDAEMLRDTYMVMRARAGKPAPSVNPKAPMVSPVRSGSMPADGDRVRRIRETYGDPMIQEVLGGLGLSAVDLTDSDTLDILEKAIR